MSRFYELLLGVSWELREFTAGHGANVPLILSRRAMKGLNMFENEKRENHESVERRKESKGSEKYGAGPGSSGSGSVQVHSQTPENRTGELNPSAPTEATEGPSTNLADSQTGRATNLGITRGEPARGEEKSNEGTIKKPSAEKHEAA